jgi:DNA-binding YbaB/EbfC family protein
MLPTDGDMSGFLAQAQAMQQQLLQAQQELAETEVTGSAGGDLVTATVRGTGELIGLVIKPEAVDPEDTETLADLVLAAVRDANTKVQAVSAAKLGPLAGGLGGGLGGGLPF